MRRRLTRISLASVAATALLAGAIVAVPAASIAAVTQTATVDCNDDIYGEVLILPGDTLQVTQTNCVEIYIDEGTVTPEPVDDIPAGTFEVSAGAYIELYGEGEGIIRIYVPSADPIDDPAGELLVTSDIEIGAEPDEFSVDQTEEADDGDHWLDGRPECAIEVGDHVFDTLEVVVSEAGDFTFRAIGTDPVSSYLNTFTNPYFPITDPALAVYTTFDPADPDANVVGCNDDRDDDENVAGDGSLADGTLIDDLYPQFGATLEPGIYTLVLTTYETVGANAWITGEAEDYSFTPGAESTTFQLWGPEGSLQILAAPIITSEAPTADLVSGTPVSFTITTSGTTPITFAITAGALPTGLTLDPVTGVISGTPTVNGTFAFTVSATNVLGTTTADYTQVVAAAAPGGGGVVVVVPPPAVHLPVVSG